MPQGLTKEAFQAWIPNIVAVRYFKEIGKLDHKKVEKLRSHLDKGYQRLSDHNIKNKDGSYNMFKGKVKSAWLTAYIVKLFAYARNDFSLNSDHMYASLDYLKKIQKPDGSFREENINAPFTTSSNKGVGLTAFVTISFISSRKKITKYDQVINKAVKNLKSNLKGAKTNYELAIIAYALALNGDSTAKDVLSRLKSNALQHNEKTYWYYEGNTATSKGTKSTRIEIAAYAIMSFVKTGNVTEAVPIMNWLITQRGSNGGFVKSVDTALGIEALTMMASVMYSNDTKIDILLSDNNEKQKAFKITKENAMSLMKFEYLNTNVRRVSCSINGTGFAHVNIAYQYNVVVPDPSKQFELNITTLPAGESFLHLKVCTKFIPINGNSSTEGTIMEINLPSGFVYDSATVDFVEKAGVMVGKVKNIF